MFLGIVTGGDAGLAGAGLHFLVGIGQQAARVLERAFGVAADCLHRLLGFLRRVVLEVFQGFQKALDLRFHAFQGCFTQRVAVHVDSPLQYGL
ncbi:hypothetical protein D3C71_1713050 [compost metagenome]